MYYGCTLISSVDWLTLTLKSIICCTYLCHLVPRSDLIPTLPRVSYTDVMKQRQSSRKASHM